MTRPDTREDILSLAAPVFQVRAAYRAVRSALQSGTLKRAAYCSRCGSPDRKGSDGRSTIQAHHLAGYDHPLVVEWLCASCHRQDTPLPEVMGAPTPGERNGQAKLKERDVLHILSSPQSGAALARELGVDRSTVNRVRRGQQWTAIKRSVTNGR